MAKKCIRITNICNIASRTKSTIPRTWELALTAVIVGGATAAAAAAIIIFRISTA